MGKKSPCQAQDPAIVEKIAAHVDYECQAIGETQREIRSWSDFARDDEESVRRRSVYESWLVHVRNLISFFRNKQDYGDEVLACHFMDDPAAWAKQRAAELQLSSDEEERVGKISHLVTHITYDRLKDKSDFGRQDHQMVLRLLKIFYDDLPARHKPRFPALAALIK